MVQSILRDMTKKRDVDEAARSKMARAFSDPRCRAANLRWESTHPEKTAAHPAALQWAEPMVRRIDYEVEPASPPRSGTHPPVPLATEPSSSCSSTLTLSPLSTSRALRAAEARLQKCAKEIDGLNRTVERLKQDLADRDAALMASSRGIDIALLRKNLLRCLRDGDVENTLPALARGLELSDVETREIRERYTGGLGGVGRRMLNWAGSAL